MALGDQRLVPTGPILVGQRHHLAPVVQARVADATRSTAATPADRSPRVRRASARRGPVPGGPPRGTTRLARARHPWWRCGPRCRSGRSPRAPPAAGRAARRPEGCDSRRGCRAASASPGRSAAPSSPRARGRPWRSRGSRALRAAAASSATRASAFSAGWQHRNMRRSWSSAMTSTSSSRSGRGSSSSISSPSPCSRCAARCLSSRRASRRRRSIARLRAVVVIHPPGFGGTPSTGQRSVAIANASATASSARSTSPSTRMRVAVQRPTSRRYTAARSACASIGPVTRPGRRPRPGTGGPRRGLRRPPRPCVPTRAPCRSRARR